MTEESDKWLYEKLMALYGNWSALTMKEESKEKFLEWVALRLETPAPKPAHYPEYKIRRGPGAKGKPPRTKL